MDRFDKVDINFSSQDHQKIGNTKINLTLFCILYDYMSLI